MTQTRQDAPDRVGAGPDAGGTPRRRVVGMAVFVAAFVAWTLTVGLPADPLVALLWLWVFTIAWNNHQRWTSHLRFARDWSPVLVFLVVYTYSRGWAYTATTVPHAYEMVAVDKAIFGVTPSVWLQRHLYDPDHVHPWDIMVSFVYFSHFITVYLVAAALWLRSRASWAAFMWRWMVLTFAGLATYILYPAAPPWWAAEHGMTGPVARLSARGWDALGLHGAGNMLDHAQRTANPVAAMPSLHFAFALCVATFFALRLRKRWIPLLALYPAAMAFTLAYTAEHHVADMLVGALYVLASFLLVSLGERLYRTRHLAHPTRPPTPTPIPAPPTPRTDPA